MPVKKNFANSVLVSLHRGEPDAGDYCEMPGILRQNEKRNRCTKASTNQQDRSQETAAFVEFFGVA